MFPVSTVAERYAGVGLVRDRTTNQMMAATTITAPAMIAIRFLFTVFTIGAGGTFTVFTIGAGGTFTVFTIGADGTVIAPHHRALPTRQPRSADSLDRK